MYKTIYKKRYHKSMENKYKFNGISEVVIPNVLGVIHPGEIVTTDFTINHPDFELISSAVSEPILEASHEDAMED